MAQPQKIGDILGDLILRKGIGRVQSTGDLESAWGEAVGEIVARQSRLGAVKRGVLEITVAHSVLVQEITFRKVEILDRLRQTAADAEIRDLRLRCGAIR